MWPILRISRLVPPAMALMLVCCAGVDKMHALPLDAAGETLYLDTSFEQAKAAVRHALTKTGFTIVEERDVDTQTWYAIGDLPSAMQSWGEFARVVLMKTSPDVTRAVIQSVRKLDSNVSEDLAGVRRNLTLNLRTYIAEGQ